MQYRLSVVQQMSALACSYNIVTLNVGALWRMTLNIVKREQNGECANAKTRKYTPTYGQQSTL